MFAIYYKMPKWIQDDGVECGFYNSKPKWKITVVICSCLPSVNHVWYIYVQILSNYGACFQHWGSVNIISCQSRTASKHRYCIERSTFTCKTASELVIAKGNPLLTKEAYIGPNRFPGNVILYKSMGCRELYSWYYVASSAGAFENMQCYSCSQLGCNQN